MQKTCIVVDDIDFARKVIKEILIQAKYSVVAEATNGNEAIALYKQYRPSFVVMDAVMPQRGGVEATRKILEENKDARIILVSAIAHEQLLFEAINAGARDYIVKPFSPEELLRAVDKAIEDEDDGSRQMSVGGASGG